LFKCSPSAIDALSSEFSDFYPGSHGSELQFAQITNDEHLRARCKFLRVDRFIPPQGSELTVAQTSEIQSNEPLGQALWLSVRSGNDGTASQ
jgi:hypothetical protein